MSAEDWRDELLMLLTPAADKAVHLIKEAVKEHIKVAEEAEERAAEAERDLAEANYEAGRYPDLLRELAEDRHRAVSTIDDGEVVDSGHHGTLRTCPDALCDAAATLLGRRG